MKYKKSRFNYVHKREENYLIYNTLYNSLVRLYQDEYAEYDSVDISSPNAGDFIEQGLWVDSTLDEKSKYLACSEAYTLYLQRPLSLTVTTTLKCNARCSYCYEKGVNQIDIEENTENKIVEFVKKNNDSKEVHLIWFGGEPLMNMDFMDRLCHALKDEGIIYSSYIISNGSLLSESIIKEKFQIWNIKDMQITLDGPKDVYETIKNYKIPGEGEFYSILNYIRIAAEAGVFVNIRLNIGRNNQDYIIDLLKELDKVYSSYENIVFYPAFLTGESEPLSEDEKVAFVKRMLISLKNIRKLTTGTKFYSLPRMHACMNGDPKSFSVDVHGNVYACEHYVGREQYKIGDLNSFFHDTDTRGKNVVFREECNDCVFLPKCYGGCEANYLENDSPCMIEKYLIQAYLEIL